MTTATEGTADIRRRKFPKKRLIAGGVLAATAVVMNGAQAYAQGLEEPETTLEQVATQVTSISQTTNLTWIVIGAAMVIFMQAGFAMVETGFTRAKHAAHVVSTNFAIFGLGFVAFFLVGFSFMFGGYSYVLEGYDYGLTQAVGGGADVASNALIGSGSWVFLWKGGWAGSWFDPTQLALTGATAAFFLYMVAFMDTTATIPTGSMAERWKWKSFIFWGLFCGAIYYPLFGAWTWGGGWLSQLGNSLGWGYGYTDFAGSGIVHAVGGAAALAGALVLGPRIGKYTKDGKPRGLPGHNIPLAFLGTFILLFGWFGFNAASTFAASDPQVGLIALNTGLAAAFGSISCMLYVWMRSGKPDPAMMANGMLAGLVAITAPCAFVSPRDSAIIGIIAGVIVVEAVYFIDRKLKVDDPVGAIAVHGVNGLFGVVAVGLFANGSYGALAPDMGWNLTAVEAGGELPAGVTGLFYGGGTGQLFSQLAGAVMICTVMFGLAFAFFKIQDAITKGGIRSEPEDEVGGLDLPEMGIHAYPEFAGTHEGYGDGGGSSTQSKEPVGA